jgi:hypothetical protein
MPAVMLRLLAIVVSLPFADGRLLSAEQAPHKHMRNYFFAGFLAEGRAPTWADMIRELRLDKDEALEAIDALSKDHDIVLLPNQQGGTSSYVLMMHPFSNLPTNHVATLDRSAVERALGRLGAPALSSSDSEPIRRYGNWYWDLWGHHYSLGSALEVDPRIEAEPFLLLDFSSLAPTDISTVCHRSGARIEQRLSGGGIVYSSHPNFAVCFVKPLRHWYDDLVATWHDALLVFADEAELELWLAESGLAGSPDSFARVSEEQLATLSRLFYGGRAAPDFERRSPAELKQAMAAAGLVGKFWQLPEH